MLRARAPPLPAQGSAPRDLESAAPRQDEAPDLAKLRPRRSRLLHRPCAKCAAFALLVLLGLVLCNAVFLALRGDGAPGCAVAEAVQEQAARRLDGSAATQLPKIVHQQWKDANVPAGPFAEYRARWHELFPEPEYTHMLWTDASGRELIREHFAWFLPAYDGYAMNIQRADAVRYFALYLYGGVYADLDYEPLTNFWVHLPSDRVGLIESPYKVNENVQNSLMSSPPRHPFWNVTFGLLYQRRASHKVLSSTGPSLMDAAVAEAPMSDWVHVLPCENFHRVPLGEAGRNSPFLSRLARSFLAHTPLSKACGDWRRRDNCQFGIHHNSVSYMSSMGDGPLDFLTNF